MGQPEQLDPEAIGALLGRASKVRAPQPERRPPTDLGLSVDDRVAASVAAGLPEWRRIVRPKFHDARLSDWSGAPLELAEKWVSDPFTVGTNLIITGPVGVGKSHLAIGAVRGLFFGGATLLVVTAKQMLTMLDWKSDEARANRRLLYGVDMLVVDDVGTVNESAWAVEELAALLDERWSRDLPNIVSTNLVPDELKAALGERAYSRLTGAYVGIKLTGEDRRKGPR